MTTIQEDAPPAKPLSERLTEPLRLVTGRMRVLAFLRAAFQLTVLIAVSWLLLILLLGLFPKLPLLLALPLAFSAWIILVGGAILLFRPILKTRDISTAARMVDDAMPESQERISSAIQLSSDPDNQFSGSPELIAVLVRQAEHAAEQLDPNLVVSGRSVALWFGATLPLMLLWFILLLVMTPSLFLGIHRLINPFTIPSAVPTATLEIDPKNTTISQGDQLTINLTVSSAGNLETKPATHASISRHLADSSANQDITGDMERTGPHTFNLFLDNVQQSFTYRISALGNDSPLYTVTVQPRPSASNIQVQYTYPAYTHLPPHADPSHDGAIDALVNTRAAVTIESPLPLTTAHMQIADNGNGPETINLLPVKNNPNHYTGEFTISKSTQYQLALTSTQNILSKDDQPRPISARTDLPPQITISSPADKLKVRPDDTVPLRFTATDDFGLTKIEALLQIDDRPPTAVLIPISPDQTKLDAKWNLNLTDLLQSLPATAAPRHLYYQLRATDNRDPNPQTGLSLRQSLLIDASTTPLAQRQDAAASKDLADAVTKASSELQSAQKKIDALRKTAAARPLTDREKQSANDARAQITQAGDTLKAAAAKAADSRLTDAAQQAKDIADTSIQKAQENTASSELAADQPTPRNQSLAAADQNLTDARQKLDQLAHDLGNNAKDQPLAQNMERLADEQKKLADQLALHPNDPKLLAQQRDLQKKLDDLIKKNPELQKPVESANQSATSDLDQKIQSLQQSQKPLNDQAQQQTDAATAPAKLNDIAKAQQDLNQKIQSFNQDQAQALKNTNSHAPDPSQLDPIVKDLQDNKPTEANRQQNAAANDLDQTASRLENAQKQQTENAGKNQKAADQANQTAQAADSIKQDTDKLADTIKQAQDAHNPPTRPSDPANQQAEKLADQITKQAQQLAKNPDQRPAAQDIQQEAAAARRDANNGNAQSAQQHLASAAQKLADAAKSAQQQNPAPAPTPADQTSAGAQARDLANKQQDLANQTASINKSIDQSQNTDPQQTAKDQQALADQMDKTAKDAQALSQKTQDGAPDLSQRAQKTADQLKQAAQSQRDAAQANQQNDPAKAAAAQQKSAQSLASAKQSISGQPPSQNLQPQPQPKPQPQPQPQQTASNQQPPSPNNNSQKPGDNQQPSPPNQQQQSPSQKPGESKSPDSTASGQQPQSPNGQQSQNSNSQKSGESKSPDGTASGQQPQSPNGQPSQNSNSQTPGQGQTPSPTASGQQQQSPNGQPSQSPGQGQSSTNIASGQPHQSQSGQPTSGGSSQNPTPGQTAGNTPSNEQSPNGQPSPNGQSSASSAAQAVQAARTAQAQAAQGDPDAARRAAQQLAQASHDLMANQNQNSNGSPTPNQNQGQPLSPGQGQSSSPTASAQKPDPNAPPGSVSSGAGVTITASNTPKLPPPSITEIGISPSDWAKLPPTMQDQLLHSAQQSGPPAYRDMIKNYYSRIARLQGPVTPGGTSQ